MAHRFRLLLTIAALALIVQACAHQEPRRAQPKQAQSKSPEGSAQKPAIPTFERKTAPGFSIRSTTVNDKTHAKIEIKANNCTIKLSLGGPGCSNRSSLGEGELTLPRTGDVDVWLYGDNNTIHRPEQGMDHIDFHDDGKGNKFILQ